MKVTIACLDDLGEPLRALESTDLILRVEDGKGEPVGELVKSR